MYKTANILLLVVLGVSEALAQRFVVIDMETKVPVRNVVVQYGKDKSTNTIWDGSFMLDTLENDSSDVTLTLSRSGYMTRTMTRDELTDTLELLPSFNSLMEVIIIGKKRTGPSFGWTLGKFGKSLPSPKTGASINTDVLGAIEKLFTHGRRKRVEETKKRMEEY